MDEKERAIRIIHLLRKATKGMEQPGSVSIIKQYGRDPYLVLISCLLSLRTKDTVSLPPRSVFFEHAKTPKQMLALPITKIEKLIYPDGLLSSKPSFAYGQPRFIKLL